jgi:hypothetical protein
MNQQNAAHPVIVNSWSHTASNGVYLSLKHYGVPCVYADYMSWDVFTRMPKQWQESRREAMDVRRQIDQTRGKIRWKVVTMVRDPLSRILSGYFHTLRQDFNPQSGRKEDYLEDEVFEYINQRLVANSGNNADAFCGYQWLICNIVHVFMIDPFCYKFNREAGYQIYSSPDTDLLVMKVERLNDVQQRAFYEFLGLRDFHLTPHNVGSTRKGSGELYKKAKKVVSFPEETVNCLAESFFMQYFYSENEIAQFRERWTRNTDPSYRLDLKLFSPYSRSSRFTNHHISKI